MRTAPKKEQFPTLCEILEGAAEQAANEGWDLAKTMSHVAWCCEDYQPVIADLIGRIIVVTGLNEDDADARQALMDEADKWEGRNNG